MLLLQLSHVFSHLRQHCHPHWQRKLLLQLLVFFHFQKQLLFRFFLWLLTSLVLQGLCLLVFTAVLPLLLFLLFHSFAFLFPKKSPTNSIYIYSGEARIIMFLYALFWFSLAFVHIIKLWIRNQPQKHNILWIFQFYSLYSVYMV